MGLFQFVRGPGMQIALGVFVAGVLWRLVGMVLLRGRRPLSEPRRRGSWKGLRLIVTRMWPRRALGSVWLDIANSYVMHLGFLIVLVLYAPHILFFRHLFGRMAGAGASAASWPALPTSVVSLAAAITLAAFAVALAQRVASPVRRLISNFDDYATLLLTVAPVATGLMLHFAGISYERMLAVHLLSVEVLLAWFPWGKLMHALTVFASRGLTGVALERKGAAL
jgi:nitrate reductase gamma subunit